MKKAEAQTYVAAAAVHRHDRADISVWTVDLPALERSIDVEAETEKEARAKAAAFLVSEEEEETS